MTLSCCRDASCTEPAGTPLPSVPDPGYRVLSGTGAPPPREVFRCPTGVARVEFTSDSCGGEEGFSFSFASGNYSGPGGGYCGDGVVQALEECDGGEGCKGCIADEGYRCAGGACSSECGDGVQVHVRGDVSRCVRAFGVGHCGTSVRGREPTFLQAPTVPRRTCRRVMKSATMATQTRGTDASRASANSRHASLRSAPGSTVRPSFLDTGAL